MGRRYAADTGWRKLAGTVTGMFRRAVRVLTVGGIEIRLDPSLAVIALLVAWTLATRFSDSHDLAIAWIMSGAATLAFFASILAHELGHALEARHRGLEVFGITLFLFGGVTEMAAHTHRPRDEFAIAAVGPWVSLVCGALFGLLATGASAAGRFVSPAITAPIADVAGLLGWMNVALAIFNLIPGAPLDGGRVLRAGLWWMLGDRPRAIRITARLGQLLGSALIALGLWTLTATSAGPVASLWYVVIGAFLISAARSEARSSKTDEILTHWTVGEAFAPTLAHPPDPSKLLTVDVDDIPLVDDGADLHQLIEAFNGGQGVVAIRRSDANMALLTERQVAHALAELRRRPRRRALRTTLPPPAKSAP